MDKKFKKLDKRLDRNHEITIFIKTGIETLVIQIIEKLDSELLDSIASLCGEFTLKNPNYQRRDIENGTKVLKVGSFYEDTKIIFPDEFDFIYVISAFDVKGEMEDSMWKKHYFTLNKFHDEIQRVLFEHFSDKNLVYETCNYCIKFRYYVRQQGPSSKLLFSYTNKICDTNNKSIKVDIVPAFQIFDEFLKRKLKLVCFSEKFANEILKVNSYLITTEISFTQAELHFMKCTLSDRHRSVYRALKYLINGDGDGEKLRSNVPSAGISTYMVKVATIKHHFSCSGYLTEPQCLLDILHYILIYATEDFDSKILCKFNGSPFEIIHDDRLAIITWLRNKIQKYEKQFSETHYSRLNTKEEPQRNTFKKSADIRSISTSSKSSPALARKIQYDRESQSSSHSSCFDGYEERFHFDERNDCKNQAERIAPEYFCIDMLDDCPIKEQFKDLEGTEEKIKENHVCDYQVLRPRHKQLLEPQHGMQQQYQQQQKQHRKQHRKQQHKHELDEKHHCQQSKDSRDELKISACCQCIIL